MPEQIPNSENLRIKEKFEERYKSLLGPRYEEFIKYSTSYLRKAIRVNTLKISVSELKKRLEKNWNLKQVPWCKEGFWIDYKTDDEKEIRYDIGNTLEHQLGYIYVQEPASMIPPVVLAPKPGDQILDMCAAPGSKTSQIAMYMKNKGTLIANDSQATRLKALGINLQRTGVSNFLTTNMLGLKFKKLNLKFDKILVDAPCSGTGTIRRSFKNLDMWGINLVRKMAAEQKQLIGAAFEILKPEGTLVYSTCTMEPEENEGVISWLLETYPDAIVENIDLSINRSTPITEFEGQNYSEEVKKCLRIWPQDNDSEGFFVCKIQKKK